MKHWIARLLAVVFLVAAANLAFIATDDVEGYVVVALNVATIETGDVSGEDQS